MSKRKVVVDVDAEVFDTKTFVEKYQCPGCVSGPYPDCYKKDTVGEGCDNHGLGTSLGLGMHIALGLPKGFCRAYLKIKDFVLIFDTFEKWLVEYEQDKFNVPVWKYLDEHGNTLIRLYQPRLNNGMVHIIKGNVMDKVNAVHTLTKEELEAMD